MSDLRPPSSIEDSDPGSAQLSESTTARSTYLYVVLLMSMIGAVVGGIIAITSVVHLIEPDTGYRDGLDRAAAGFVEVAGDGLDVARGYLDADTPTVGELCGSDMEPDCVDYYDSAYGSETDVTESIDGILTSIQDETRRQIRMASIGWLVIGLVLLSSSLRVFRYHAPKSALYRPDVSSV